MRSNNSSFDLNRSEHLAAFWRDGAVYRWAPNEWLICVGPWRSAPESEAHLGEMSFFSTEMSSWRAAQTALLGTEDFRRLLESRLGERELRIEDFAPISRENFEKSFQLVQGKIQREEIVKAVICGHAFNRRRPSPSDLAHSLFHMLNLPESLHVYAFWKDGEGVIGATPEYLLAGKSPVYRTMALAGSSPRDENGQRQPLNKDPKELREHQLVVEDLLERLRPLGWLRQEPTEVLELPTLRHLKTSIELTGCAKTPGELVRHLHPTAALGVAPRAYGYRWLRELPGQTERGRFGAPVVFRRDDEVRALVAIRSLFWEASGTCLWAGCGIVAASQLEREWLEIQAKAQSVLHTLGLK